MLVLLDRQAGQGKGAFLFGEDARLIEKVSVLSGLGSVVLARSEPRSRYRKQDVNSVNEIGGFFFCKEQDIELKLCGTCRSLVGRGVGISGSTYDQWRSNKKDKGPYNGCWLAYETDHSLNLSSNIGTNSPVQTTV